MLATVALSGQINVFPKCRNRLGDASSRGPWPMTWKSNAMTKRHWSGIHGPICNPHVLGLLEMVHYPMQHRFNGARLVKASQAQTGNDSYPHIPHMQRLRDGYWPFLLLHIHPLAAALYFPSCQPVKNSGGLFGKWSRTVRYLRKSAPVLTIILRSTKSTGVDHRTQTLYASGLFYNARV